MKREDAEEFTQSLSQIVGGSYRLIQWARNNGIPKSLGMSVKEWVNVKLGGYVKYEAARRGEIAVELAAEGESNVAIAELLGVDERSVRRDLDSANAESATNEISHLESDHSANAEPLDAVALLAADDTVRAEAIQEAKRKERREELAEVEARKAPPPDGKYSVIVIDPPWEMEKIERRVRPNQVEFDYPTMSEERLAAHDEILAMPADDCHLFCWATQKHLPAAMRLIEKWGFKYVLTLVWHKPGGPQPFGLPQYNCEFCLYARRGSPKFVDTKSFFTCFQAPRREHSRKPDEFYDTVRRVTEGPRIDVFSREKREGFEQFGNEKEKFAA